MRKQNKKGFTLAELLIVVAIIAVLVAAAFPIFTGQLERARESVDAGSIRSAYAEVMTAVITDDKSAPLWTGALWKSEEQALKQKQDGWSTADLRASLEAFGTQDGAPASGGSFWVSYDPDAAAGTNPVTIHYGTGVSGGSTPILSASQQINEKLEAGNIMTTYDKYANGKWTGAKAAVSAVNVFNNTDTGNSFTQTLKDVVGDIFTYQVANGTLADGTKVRYLYITTDGTYGQCRAAVHGAVLFHAVFVGVGLEKPRPVLKEKTPARPEFFSFCRFRKYQRKGAALSHLAFQLHPGAQIGGAVLHDGEA